MGFTHFFVDRPIFATVISVVFVLAGAVFWLIDVRRDHCLGISG